MTGQRNFKPRHKRDAPGRTFNGRKHIDNLYDHNWEKYRRKFLDINHRCYSCGQVATIVDHLVPHLGDKKLFEKTDNHIPLCKPCHDRITGLFDRKYRVGNPVDNKIKWMNYNRQLNEITFKVKVLPSYP